MFSALNFLRSLYDLLAMLIDKFSKPNPNYIKDKINYEITHTRNKAVLMAELIMGLLFTVEVCMARGLFSIYIIKMTYCVLVISVLVLSCHYHPQLFRIFFNLTCLAYGPLVVSTNDLGILKVWHSTLIFPLCVYLFTGSAMHFVFQTIIQAIYTNTIYRNHFENTIVFATPGSVSTGLTHSMNTSIFLVTILVILSHHLMQTAYSRIATVEKKKDEFENQKTFLLGFSHELRNLINSLIGNVKLASLENLTERAKELLLNAEVCSELLHHLVNNILDTGKVEIGELEINPVPTRTYDAVERMWGICSELIRRKHLNGSLKIEKNLPKTLIVDHYRLTQIFLNLIGNAVKFTDTGSIDIAVSWLSHTDKVDNKCFEPYPFNESDDHDEGLFEKEKVFSSLDENLQILGLMSRKINKDLLVNSNTTIHRGVLKVVISDTGCGMAKEETEKLFQKFTQVTSDNSKRKLGTGLGLFITKELCQRMSGDIKVFSKKEKGSSFIFCIPANIAYEENEHLTNLETTRRFLASQNLKVMIVDDAPFSHTVLKCFFEKLGIEVVDIAVNGLEACQKFSQAAEKGTRFDIITMDLEMPIMDGKEAARKIRQLEAEKNLAPCFLPIISANCIESEIAECMDKQGRIKADGFLKKPASIEELLKIIGRHFIR